jgi:hypothetical protein
MKTFIVTEGAVAGVLMERLVRCHPVLRERRVVVRAADYRSSVWFKSRTLLCLKHVPVAAVFNPETVHPDYLSERRGFAEQYIGEASWTPGDFLIFDVPPNVAVLLFQDEGVMRGVLPAPLSIEDRVRARYEPEVVLAEQLAQAGEGPFLEALAQRLAGADLSGLWRLDALKPLEEFLLRVSEVQPAWSPEAP